MGRSKTPPALKIGVNVNGNGYNSSDSQQSLKLPEDHFLRVSPYPSITDFEKAYGETYWDLGTGNHACNFFQPIAADFVREDNQIKSSLNTPNFDFGLSNCSDINGVYHPAEASSLDVLLLQDRSTFSPVLLDCIDKFLPQVRTSESSVEKISHDARFHEPIPPPTFDAQIIEGQGLDNIEDQLYRVTATVSDDQESSVSLSLAATSIDFGNDVDPFDVIDLLQPTTEQPTCVEQIQCLTESGLVHTLLIDNTFLNTATIAPYSDSPEPVLSTHEPEVIPSQSCKDSGKLKKKSPKRRDIPNFPEKIMVNGFEISAEAWAKALLEIDNQTQDTKSNDLIKAGKVLFPVLFTPTEITTSTLTGRNGSEILNTEKRLAIRNAVLWMKHCSRHRDPYSYNADDVPEDDQGTEEFKKFEKNIFTETRSQKHRQLEPGTTIVNSRGQKRSPSIEERDQEIGNGTKRQRRSTR